jgi:hypothetical protein
MAFHLSPEEKEIIKFIEKNSFTDTSKKQWVKLIQAEGLNEELADKIHAKFSKLPLGEKEDEFTHGKRALDLANLIRRWRMAKNAKKFHERR